MGAQPGRARPATRASQTPLRLARERPSSVCNNAAAPVCKLQTPPKPAPACKEKDAAGKWGAKQFLIERPWEGGRDWRSKAWISPHPWIPSLLTPPPRAPGSALAKVGRKRELERRPGGRAPPPGPIVPGLREAAQRGPPPPRNSASRVGTGPRPLPKLGFCVCKGGGSWHQRHAPLSSPTRKKRES